MIKEGQKPGRGDPGCDQMPRHEALKQSYLDMAAIWVTDFYGLPRIDARQALYVIGSDVLGPMGHELVPLASREDAEDFRKDHKGRRIRDFAQVAPTLPAMLDEGRF